MRLQKAGWIGLALLAGLHPDAYSKTLKIRAQASPMTLDWTGQVTVTDAPLVVNLCEGLYSFDYSDTKNSEKLVPAIASMVIKSKDLKQYQFKIREDAKWSDGRSIYAKDFVDAWQRLISPQGTSIYANYLFEVENAREYHQKKLESFDEVGIKAVDDRTLLVKLKNPNKNWEVNTTFWPLFPVRKDLIEKFGASWWRAGTLVSSGPFVFSSFEPEKKAILKRNPYYRKTKSNIDEIEVDFIFDQEEAIRKYQEGIYPFMSGIRAEKFIKSKDFKFIPFLRHYVIAINSERYPMNNRFFRLAVLSSINRDQMIPENYMQFTKATQLIPQILFSSKEDLSVPYDPVKAREYLEKSGVVRGKGFKISFLTGLGSPYLEISKRIASQIETTLGITVDTMAFKNQEFETFSNLGEYGMVMISWTAKVRTPQDFLYPYSSYYSTNNRTRYQSSAYDEAIARADFKAAQSIISRENGVLLPLFFEKTGYLSNVSLKNLYFDHRGLALLKDVVAK